MKVAVAGLGWWGRQIISCLAKSSRFDILYGVDPAPPAGTDEFLAEYGIRHGKELSDVLPDKNLEGVILATPHSLHEEQCLAVIAAGKELFCEKPLTMTAMGAAQVIEACQRRGKILGIGHERRYEEGFEQVQSFLDRGVLGKPLLFEANVSHDLFRNADKSNWRLDPKHAPGGMMTGTGIHLTDLAICFFGPVATVQAHTATLVFEPPAIDFVNVALSFKCGARGTITLLSCTPYCGRVAVFGDRGWVEVVSEGNVDQGKPATATLCTGTREPREVKSYKPSDTVTQNFEAWASAVMGEGVYRFTKEQILENIKVFEAIVNSATASGAVIEM
jgi:predicted dehydrogenase